MPLRGVKERSQVGLLHWDKSENKDDKTEVEPYTLCTLIQVSIYFPSNKILFLFNS